MKSFIGIDSISFSTSKYCMGLDILAANRNVDYKKYCEGIRQKVMSIFPPNEDIVTIAVDAAKKVLLYVEDKNKIDLLIFATESSFDISKAAGIYVHRFLELKQDCRVFDIKQACYSVTAAIRMAQAFVVDNPGSKVLVVGSDIVKYSFASKGEPTQGGAAVAMIISELPRVLFLERYSGVHTEDVMDFWRPVKSDEAMFNGELSAYNYLKSLDITFNKYLKSSKLSPKDIDLVCFHAPFGKMAVKAAKQLSKEMLIKESLFYNELIGNSCSASLYICLISLLENISENLSGKRIGLYSYGSGSVAEYFSGIVVDGYRNMFTAQSNIKMLNNRFEISFKEYELFYREKCGYNKYENIGNIKLAGIKNSCRIYELIC